MTRTSVAAVTSVPCLFGATWADRDWPDVPWTVARDGESIS